MANIVAWILIGWAFAAITMSRPLGRAVLWMLDMVDRWTNPRTRERIRRHNELVARFRADVDEYSKGRH